MRTLLHALLAALLLASLPAASAQDDAADPERPDDAAWTDDCPPDMMCAMDAGGEADNASADEPTYSGDCGGEVCAYDGGERPDGALGPEGCIDCMTPPKDGASDCMDGEQAGETCDDDVQYMAPPADTEGQPRQETQASGASQVPGPSLAALAGILGVVAIGLAVARRR